MNSPPKSLTIGALATAAEVNVETIRYYQRKALMREPQRAHGELDLQRLRFIKSAQRLGFSLDEIAQLLTLDDGAHCAAARTQAQHKLLDVRAKLADLQRMEATLADLVQRCTAARGNVQCPLIASLQGLDRS